MAPKIWDLLSESQTIINSQRRHYLTLSTIFLLPLSFLSLIFQLIFKHLQQQPPTNPNIIIFLSLLFFLISSIFTYSAFITITYSVYNAAFFNRPVKLKEAIKSITTSFFPLLATATVRFVVLFFIFFLFGILIILVLFLIIYLGDVDLTTNPYLVMLCSIVLMIVLLPLVMYLAVNLSLVNVIVVVESCWGFEPLKRSWKLVKGMKRLVLSTFSLFGFLQWILVWISNYNWVLIFVVSPILAIISLYNIAVYTVLYIYSKEKHGELGEVEFGKEKDGASLSLIP